LNNSASYLNWKLDDNGDYPITSVFVEWRDTTGKMNNIEKTIRIDSNFNGTVIVAAIPDNADVRIRLRNALGYSEFSDSTKYKMATCMPSICNIRPS
jgi:hypothetical protein